MKSNNYIEDKLDYLIELFPQMKASYKYNDFSNSHLIEILPCCEFKGNSQYAKHETDLIIDFITKFPSEEIVFITDDDLIAIENPTYVRTGNLYYIKSLSWNSQSWSNNTPLNVNLNSNKYPEKDMTSFNLTNNTIESFDFDHIILNPLKQEPIDYIVNCDDFVFAA